MIHRLSISSLQNQVSLESVRVASDPNIESIDPLLRGCLFPHEQPENYTMKAHQKYTQESIGGKYQANCGLKFKTLRSLGVLHTGMPHWEVPLNDEGRGQVRALVLPASRSQSTPLLPLRGRGLQEGYRRDAIGRVPSKEMNSFWSETLLDLRIQL